MLLEASGASGGSASMFGKDEKTCVTRCDPTSHLVTFLTSEFWDCRTNSLFIRLIRLLKPGCFQLDYLESFMEIAWDENFSFVLDPTRVNNQFPTDSDGNLPRVIGHSQGLRKT
jgi:hypothetical protein